MKTENVKKLKEKKLEDITLFFALSKQGNKEREVREYRKHLIKFLKGR